MTGNCEGDKIKAVIDTNEVQEIDPDAKADAGQSSGNKGNERKKNSPSPGAGQTLKGLELNYDNDFDYKRQIDANISKEPQAAKNSCNLSPNGQFDNLLGHWTNKCNQVPLEREFFPEEQLAYVQNYTGAIPLDDQSGPTRCLEVEMMPTSRADKYFAPTSSVDNQDDEIIY